MTLSKKEEFASVDLPLAHCWLSAQCHWFAVEEHPMPQFQGDQREDFFGVCPGIAVGMDQLFNGALLKVSALDRLPVGQNIANLIFEIIAQPKFVWNGKTSLFSFQNARRHPLG